MPNAKSRIQLELDQQGHTYRSIAGVIGITPQAVSEIVNGRTTGATARYALAAALGARVADFWGNGSAPMNGASNGRRAVQAAQARHTVTAPRKELPGTGEQLARADAVAVSICCPRRGVPSSICLGVDEFAADGTLTVFQCEHFPRRPVGCDMECLTAPCPG